MLSYIGGDKNDIFRQTVCLLTSVVENGAKSDLLPRTEFAPADFVGVLPDLVRTIIPSKAVSEFLELLLKKIELVLACLALQLHGREWLVFLMNAIAKAKNTDASISITRRVQRRVLAALR